MKTAITPKLTHGHGYLFTPRGRHYWGFCANGLGQYVEIPKAKAYWIEIADCQWKDRSGTPIQVKIVSGAGWPESIEWRLVGGKYYQNNLCHAAESAIIKFIGPKTKIATIYFRLLYEE